MPLEASDRLVIFGITGDLAHKMTLPSLFRLERRGLLKVPVLGVAFDDMTRSQFVDFARQVISEHVEHFDSEVFDRLAARFNYVHGDFSDPALYSEVASACGGSKSPTFYLEIPPSLFVTVAENLVAVGLTEGDGRIVFEKPFGTSLETAVALNAKLHTLLREEQIFRIDHYLGKDPVMDLLYLRFSNTLFEPVWNHNHALAIMVTMAEDFGVDDRGSFYDSVGTVRDVVQNHLMQVLAMVSMEIPVQDLSDQRADLFRCIPQASLRKAVFGQYDGYLDVKGVKPNSITETFVALELNIESWRWGGIPVFIRAGKKLPVKATEVVLRLSKVPPVFVGGKVRRLKWHDDIVLRLGDDPGVNLAVHVKSPGADAVEPVNLRVDFKTALGEAPSPYEVLLLSALKGDNTLFPDERSVEETWRIMDPLLARTEVPLMYEPGTWGPQTAIDMANAYGGWREPTD
ncbi:MAG: glucose-6-phosphate dehydrogenase [Candidatus Nanopelagicales bacterium]|nr:glucose-6-phosphate dehydrogenase [Candidatus Nanopelagicales bacterium]